MIAKMAVYGRTLNGVQSRMGNVGTTGRQATMRQSHIGSLTASPGDRWSACVDPVRVSSRSRLFSLSSKVSEGGCRGHREQRFVHFRGSNLSLQLFDVPMLGRIPAFHTEGRPHRFPWEVVELDA